MSTQSVANPSGFTRPERRDFTPQRFHLDEQNQDGTLEIRSKRYPTKVTEMNSCEFIAFIDEKTSQKVGLGSCVRLRILDVDCNVRVHTKSQFEDGTVRLEMHQVDENYSSGSNSGIFIASDVSRSTNVSGRSSFAPMIMIIGIFAAIALFPIYGKKLSATEKVSKSIERAWKQAVASFNR
jgi:hypothetical protein